MTFSQSKATSGVFVYIWKKWFCFLLKYCFQILILILNFRRNTFDVKQWLHMSYIFFLINEKDWRVKCVALLLHQGKGLVHSSRDTTDKLKKLCSLSRINSLSPSYSLFWPPASTSSFTSSNSRSLEKDLIQMRRSKNKRFTLEGR